MKNKIKNIKGFSLLELLVVVLIIGVLAAIALPQYQFAVGKSKYSTLKEATISLKGSMDRYYMIYNYLPTNFDDIDMDFNVKKHNSYDTFFSLTFDDMYCDVYNSSALVYCFKNIFGKDMYYWINDSHRVCYAGSNNTNDLTNRICQQETHKKPQDCQLDSNGICRYFYY